MTNSLSRAYGIQLGRLLEYKGSFNQALSQSAGANRFRLTMIDLAIKNAGKRVNGNVASYKTVQASKDAMGGMATTLWGLGFQIESPEGFTEKHVRVIVRYKWAMGLSVGGMSVLMTQLHKLEGWIKKPGMVKHPSHYLPEVDQMTFRRKKVAEKSKSVTGNGYVLEDIINRADEIDARFGVMVRLAIAFGLRRCELLQIKPHVDDKVLYLDIRKGVAKNGRHRAIPIESDIQRNCLNYAKTIVRINEHLGWLDNPKQDGTLLKRNENRYNDYMQQIGLTKKVSGITGHGLRAEYAEAMALSKGFIPATLGGTKTQMLENMSLEANELARRHVAENMGHSRLNVTSSYYGTLTVKIPNSLGQRLGMIQISGDKLATIFINPPVIAQPNGSYSRMASRKLDSACITALIEIVKSGIGNEIAKIDLQRNSKTDQLTIEEQGSLMQLSSELLLKFGVDLMNC